MWLKESNCLWGNYGYRTSCTQNLRSPESSTLKWPQEVLVASSRWEFDRQFCDLRATIPQSSWARIFSFSVRGLLIPPPFPTTYSGPFFQRTVRHWHCEWPRGKQTLRCHSVELKTLCQSQRLLSHRPAGTSEGICGIGANSYLLTVGFHFPFFPAPWVGARGETKTLISRTL